MKIECNVIDNLSTNFLRETVETYLNLLAFWRITRQNNGNVHM